MGNNGGGSWGPIDEQLSRYNELKRIKQMYNMDLTSSQAKELKKLESIINKITPAKSKFASPVDQVIPSNNYQGFEKLNETRDPLWDANRSPFKDSEAYSLSYDGKSIPHPAPVVQPAVAAAAVAQATKQVPVAQSQFVNIPETRYATVDPLNIFGNRNGVNPFAQNNQSFMQPDRFSGGVATPAVKLSTKDVPRNQGIDYSMF